MTISTDFFVGPAVVVDDKINLQEAGMTAIVEQLENASIPVLARTALPPEAEIRHWRGFALIILDWELITVGGEVGVKLPDALREQNAETVASFVEILLTDLYCPVFVLSNQDVNEINEELARRLNVSADQVTSRVLVRSKASVATDLLSELENWVKAHPAIYALKSWEVGYNDARRQMFSDFELSSGDWPRILWAASEKDRTNAHFELTETISRNILHRFEPLVFDTDVLTAQTGTTTSISALRSVIHRSAVVPESSLHDDVIMPGDFFDAPDGNATDLLVNVTPGCDLVLRTGDDVKMTVLRASLLAESEFSSKTKREELRKHPDPTNEVIWVMSPDGWPYRVDFKGWAEVSWLEYKARRLGRLLDPYVIQLQQRFALHFHRQGLPRLPDAFYER